MSALPDEREMDVLLSTGEQITIAKLAILLKMLGQDAISLTGWQAGIYTSSENQNAKIEFINTNRIQQELKQEKVVVIAGFQGIDEEKDITTLGRGGSDTTAVAVASALQAKHCYIFSDVDGIYTTDPNRVTIAKKLDTLSYEEMLDISSEGAKVLHNRCIEVGEKYQIPIIAKSTFEDRKGTIITDKIEDTSIKGIVKNDDVLLISLVGQKINVYTIYNLLIKNNILPEDFHFVHSNKSENMEIQFTVKNSILSKLQNILEVHFQDLKIDIYHNTKIAIVGHGMKNNYEIIAKIIEIIEKYQLIIKDINISESKVSILIVGEVNNRIVEELHKKLIN